MTYSLPIDIAPRVAEALHAQQGVVALESTIITHGMPYPKNVETALAVEATVRANGAVPATIAVIEGRIRIGLDDEALQSLATATDFMKLSRPDVAYAVASRKNGSTTVAATMICAQLAGISVFATGGIGGVHRGVADTMDISADLTEFARTNVAVVCAGAKALLDLPKTLEYLETAGVPVVCYRSDVFPAFWSRDSGLPAPLRLDSVDDIAMMIQVRNALGLRGGTVIGNPVPEASEISRSRMDRLVEEALADARKAGVTGKAITPFLLQRIYELSDGDSLDTNIALVHNNATLGAHLANRLAVK